MAYQTESSKVVEIPPNFYIGHLIGGKGKTIRDIQTLTGAEIIIPKGKATPIRLIPGVIVVGMHPNPSKTLEIRGSPNAVKLAEEFVLAFFKIQDPSHGSDGLHNSFLSEIVSKLPTDSILRKKIVTSGFFKIF